MAEWESDKRGMEDGRMAGEEREEDGCATGMGAAQPFNETVIYASLRNHKT